MKMPLNTYLRKANLTDVDGVCSLIQSRIDDQLSKNITQWKDYFKYYPRDYFVEKAEIKELLIRKNEINEIIGACCLNDHCPRWDGIEGNAYYLHNLCSHPKYRRTNIGRRMIKSCQEIAQFNNKDLIRLDCSSVHSFVNEYYDELGFKFKGQCKVGDYVGNLLELDVQKQIPI